MKGNKRIGKDGFKYWGGFDIDDINEIEALPRPWQRYFLNRVKSKLEEKGWSQSKVCKESESIIINSSIIDTSYRIHENTFSQYTNVRSNNLRVPPVDCIIALSESLDVSVDYLLGIDSAESKEKTDIQEVTGLNGNSINLLASNKLLQDFINYSLSSPLLDAVCEQINNISISELLVRDFMNAYSDELREKLEEAINKFNNISFAFNRNEDSLKQILTSILPIIEISPIKDFLRDNLSDDRFNQININVENNPDDQHLYNEFIKDTCMCIYDIANYKYNEDYYSSELSHAFISLIKNYDIKEKGTF